MQGQQASNRTYASSTIPSLTAAAKHPVESKQRAHQHSQDLLALAKLEHPADQHPTDSDGETAASLHAAKYKPDDDGIQHRNNEGETHTPNATNTTSQRTLQIRIHFFKMAERSAQHALVQYELRLREAKELEMKRWTSQVRWKRFCQTRRY